MEAVPIREIVQNLIFAEHRCDSCGYGLRHRDKSGERLWCKSCIDIYYRKENLKPEKAEKEILEMVGLLYFDATIEDLDKDVRDKLLELKYGQNVFMYGPVGTGKTHAMAALIRRSVYEGCLCERINFDSFCVKVRSTFSPAAKITAWEMTKALKNSDKLFIDDLGLRSTPESQFAYDTFYEILNKRQEKMLPTFISSNKTIEQLGQTFDARIASRLKTALIIEMKGGDRRIIGVEHD